jgi:hypothetical protein
MELVLVMPVLCKSGPGQDRAPSPNGNSDLLTQRGLYAVAHSVSIIAERIGRMLEQRGLIERDCQNARLSFSADAKGSRH